MQHADLATKPSVSELVVPWFLNAIIFEKKVVYCYVKNIFVQLVLIFKMIQLVIGSGRYQIDQT